MKPKIISICQKLFFIFKIDLFIYLFTAFILLISKTNGNSEKPFKTLLYIGSTLDSKNPSIAPF